MKAQAAGSALFYPAAEALPVPALVGIGVVLLVSKGNLRHRIAKLGTEVPETELTEVQRELRRVAVAQNFDVDTPPERPGWANGAFLYLEPEHAAAIEKVVKQYGLKLQSKHVLASEGLKSLVIRALQEGPEGPGREAFLMRRAGFVERSVLMPLPTLRPLVLIHVKPGVMEARHSLALPGAGGQDCEFARSWDVLRDIAKVAASLAAERHADPECPGWACGARIYLSLEHVEEGRAQHIKALLAEGRLQLGNGQVIASSDYRTLVERALGVKPEEGQSAEAFLSSRSEVIVHEEALPEPNLFLEKPSDLESAGVDDCGTPDKNWLLISLDGSQRWWKEVDDDLAEFLTSPPSVQKLDTEMWTSAWQHVYEENNWIEMRDDAGSGWRCPFCTLCGKWAEVPHLLSDKCKSRVRAHGDAPGPLLAAILEAASAARLSDLCDEVAPAIQLVPQTSPLLRVCPTLHCEYPAGGRASKTHCCKRCEYADKHGGRGESWKNATGEGWKKPHGPECTCHTKDLIEQFAKQLEEEDHAAWWRKPSVGSWKLPLTFPLKQVASPVDIDSRFQ